MQIENFLSPSQSSSSSSPSSNDNSFRIQERLINLDELLVFIELNLLFSFNFVYNYVCRVILQVAVLFIDSVQRCQVQSKRMHRCIVNVKQ